MRQRISGRGALLALLGLGLAACAATPAEVNRLAKLPPLPYRIAVVGGGFLPAAQRNAPAVPGEGQILSRLWEPGQVEPIAFDRIVDTLRRGRTASSLLLPPTETSETAALRERLAGGDGAAFDSARKRAETQGADLVLLIEGVRDGPVRFLGVTGEWPITTVAWLMVGLGVFIPDHRYEANVRLFASLRDVHSGRRLMTLRVSPTPVTLALARRTDFLGLVTSIVVPPSLVGSDEESVVAALRSDCDDLIPIALLARLKDAETLDTLRAAMPIDLRLGAEGRSAIRISVSSGHELQELSIEKHGDQGAEALSEARIAEFRRALLGSRKREGERFVYEAVLGELARDGEYRVLLQDAAGQRTSSTIRLGGPGR